MIMPLAMIDLENSYRYYTTGLHKMFVRLQENKTAHAYLKPNVFKKTLLC